MQQPTILIIDDCHGTSTGTLSKFKDLADSLGTTYRVVSTTAETVPSCATYEYSKLQEPEPIVRPKPTYRHWRKGQDRHRFHQAKWSIGG